MITRAEIEELRRLHEKAELGSLKVNRHDHDCGDINWQVQQEDDPGEVIANALESDFDNPRAVAELIAGAVNALPSLLDAADERDRLAKEHNALIEMRRQELENSTRCIVEALSERDRLRALLVECKSALCPVPGWPENTAAREIRSRIEAELACGQAVVAHETPEGD